MMATKMLILLLLYDFWIPLVRCEDNNGVESSVACPIGMIEGNLFCYGLANTLKGTGNTWIYCDPENGQILRKQRKIEAVDLSNFPNSSVLVNLNKTAGNVASICRVPKFGKHNQCSTGSFFTVDGLKDLVEMPERNDTLFNTNEKLKLTCKESKTNLDFVCGKVGWWQPSPDSINCEGFFCEIFDGDCRNDEESSNFCSRNGICVNTLSGPICECYEGYGLDHCEFNRTKFESNFHGQYSTTNISSNLAWSLLLIWLIYAQIFRNVELYLGLPLVASVAVTTLVHLLVFSENQQGLTTKWTCIGLVTTENWQPATLMIFLNFLLVLIFQIHLRGIIRFEGDNDAYKWKIEAWFQHYSPCMIELVEKVKRQRYFVVVLPILFWLQYILGMATSSYPEAPIFDILYTISLILLILTSCLQIAILDSSSWSKICNFLMLNLPKNYAPIFNSITLFSRDEFPQLPGVLLPNIPDIERIENHEYEFSAEGCATAHDFFPSYLRDVAHLAILRNYCFLRLNRKGEMSKIDCAIHVAITEYTHFKQSWLKNSKSTGLLQLAKLVADTIRDILNGDWICYNCEASGEQRNFEKLRIVSFLF
ncbi:unnamed protein product [Caenorhabditis bovis]|uniref:EGF-like domain-containing protein n=1 Tax=Caenorhabditis bovis TaxID=2654633 RepID=A0A8S1EFZ0_9PELO|nr:unnamed protein product [Caenorhabditis bovis]